MIPCQSKLIAASLKSDEIVVENEMPLRKKLEALKLIIEADEGDLEGYEYGLTAGALSLCTTYIDPSTNITVGAYDALGSSYSSTHTITIKSTVTEDGLIYLDPLVPGERCVLRFSTWEG